MVSIFTPTYNRAHTLERLYSSLKTQTNKNFEWIIVDDGSSDNSEELIKDFILESLIEVRYIKQENAGKHIAINRGVELAKYELFFIVDSDDELDSCAIELILQQYEFIKDDDCFAGVCGLKAYFSGEKVGGEATFEVLDCSSLDFRFVYHQKGDMAEVFKTKILRSYPFPSFPNEKFCPELLVWTRIAEKFKLRYFAKKIYYCEYLTDGLTAKITKIRMESPEATLMCYSELSKSKIPFHQKIKACINFWRFSFCSTRSIYSKIKDIHALSLIILPISYIFHLKDKSQKI